MKIYYRGWARDKNDKVHCNYDFSKTHPWSTLLHYNYVSDDRSSSPIKMPSVEDWIKRDPVSWSDDRWNGELFTKVGDRTSLGSGKCLLEIGHGTSSSKFWKGNLDELEVYKTALTHKQIYQVYLTTKDGNYDKRVMISEVTNLGEYWQCVVTPNDGIQDDIPVYSNILRIKKYKGGD